MVDLMLAVLGLSVCAVLAIGLCGVVAVVVGAARGARPAGY